MVEGLHGFALLSEVIILVAGRGYTIFRLLVLHPTNINQGEHVVSFLFYHVQALNYVEILLRDAGMTALVTKRI